MKTFLQAFLLLFCSVGTAGAAVVGEGVIYRHNSDSLEGFVAYDDATENKRPGVLVVHEWNGPGEYTRKRAQQLAELGYVAFAVDMYGKNVRPKTHEEAAQVSAIYRNDRSLMRNRIRAALDVLKKHPLVDDSKIAAIGYCFGGTTVLELARSGAEVKGVVGFHGALSTPKPEDAKNIKAKVLVLHGADDPHVTKEQVQAFESEMKAAGVDYKLIQYPGAVHSFTVPQAGDDPSTGMAYHEEAANASWAQMKVFFEGIFGS